MRKTCAKISISIAILAVSTSTLWAQNNPNVATPDLTQTEFNERYDKNPDSNKTQIAGITIGRIGSAGQLSPIDIDKITLAKPSNDINKICVRATTQDGRFLASNPYRYSTSAKTLETIILEPITFRFKNHLKKYTGNQIAIKAYFSQADHCNVNGAILLPELRQGHPIESSTEHRGSWSLRLLINSGNRATSISAKATTDKNNTSKSPENSSEHLALKGLCITDNSVGALAYDKICKVDLSALKTKDTGKLIELTVVINDGFVEKPYNYTLYLPQLDLG